MQIRSVGIDLGKTTFHLVALGDNGKVLLRINPDLHVLRE
jgi:transposase